MSNKQWIIELIEKGIENTAIAETVGTSRSYVQQVRAQFNSAMPIGERIQSRRHKPKEGTASRRIYDYIVANPFARHCEIERACQCDGSLITRVQRRYLGRSD